MIGLGGRGVVPARAPLKRSAAVVVLALVVGALPLWLLSRGLPFAQVDALLPVRSGSWVSGSGIRAMVTWAGQMALVVAWSAWTWMLVGIVLEIRYWVSGRSPAHLPAGRTMQWLAAGLVGTAFALGGVARTSHQLQPGGSRVQAGRAVPSTVHAATDGPGRSMAVLSDVDGRVPPGVEYGLRQSTASTPDGHPAPGPPNPEIPEPPSAAHPRVGIGMPLQLPGRHRVAARETLWSVADVRLGEARRWKEIAQLNYGREQVDGGALTEDHWIRPGWELVLPGGTVDSADSSGSPVTADDGATMARPCGAAGDAAIDRIPNVPRVPVPVPVPVVPVGAGIVGVGVTGLIDRLRRVQQRRRPSGERIRLPDPVLRRFEQRLRMGDAAGALAAAEEAVRQFVATSVTVDPAGAVLGVTVSDESVELVLDRRARADGAPPCFRWIGDGSALAIDRCALDRTLSEAVATRGPASARRDVLDAIPTPALVTIGKAADRVTLLNLEAFRSVVVSGEPVLVEGVFRALALELATSRWAAGFDLVVVGFGTDLARFERVTVTDNTGALSADLAWRALRDSVRLDDMSCGSVTEARCRGRSGGWDPDRTPIAGPLAMRAVVGS